VQQLSPQSLAAPALFSLPKRHLERVEPPLKIITLDQLIVNKDKIKPTTALIVKRQYVLLPFIPTTPPAAPLKSLEQQHVGVLLPSGYEGLADALNRQGVGTFTLHASGKSSMYIRKYPFTQDALDRGYDSVVLFLGMNDLPLSSDEEMKDELEALQAMVDELQERKICVLVVTPTPSKGSPVWDGTSNKDPDDILEKTMALKGWTLSLAAVGVVDAYTLMGDATLPDVLNRDYAAVDRLHLSTAGYDALAVAIKEKYQKGACSNLQAVTAPTAVP
jgi:lysophospholipase L1-like esterase